MSERYDNYLDDWLPEDDDETEGSYDFDYDMVPKEPENEPELTIDDYEDSRQNDRELTDKDGLTWVYWR